MLGLLTAPSARVGARGARPAAGGDGTRDRKEPRRGPYRAGADAAEPLLGILSGPGEARGQEEQVKGAGEGAPRDDAKRAL